MEPDRAARLLESTVNSLDGYVCIVRRDGTILLTNRRWDAAAGSGHADVFAAMAALAPPHADRLTELLRDALEDDAHAMAEKFRVERGGRPPTWYVVRIHPVLDHEEARAVVNLVDITEGMRTQEELRRITEEARSLATALSREKALLAGVISAIPHLVYWKDHHLRYAGVNAAFLAVRGLPGADQVVGRSEDELGVADDLSRLLAATEPRVVATGRPVSALRTSVRDSAGELRSLLLSVLPHPIDPEAPTGVIGVAADITHVSELERKLAQASRLESMGELAAGVAHELNTPVQYLSDNTQFLADSFQELLAAVEEIVAAADLPAVRTAVSELDLDFLRTEIPDAFADSRAGLDRVSTIVSAMKDFSHPGRKRADFDVNAAVEATAALSRGQWNAVADLVLELDPQAGAVSGYKHDLTQALLNIVVNAAQAIAEMPYPVPQGAAPGAGTAGATAAAAQFGRIEIRTQGEPDRVVVTVSDNGPGMDDHTRSRVFDQFFTTKDVGIGTGQGLSLAYRTVVRQHHGELTVQSAPGQGATFTMVLPRCVPED